MVFPGNLQGRHPKETGAKGCTLVTVEDRQVVAVEHRAIDVLRWAAIEVDATGADVVELTRPLAESACGRGENADGRPVLARVTLTGATDLHATLLDDTDQLAAECRNAAIEAGVALWVESDARADAAVRRRSDDDVLAPLRAAFAAGSTIRPWSRRCSRTSPRCASACRRLRARRSDVPEDADGLRALARMRGRSWPTRCPRNRARMKLRRLDLLRYGHLADVALAFPPDAALHVVHGANEAGKSTALAAIADALFGFGHRTDYDFLHGGPQLRIGFALAAQDGTRLRSSAARGGATRCATRLSGWCRRTRCAVFSAAPAASCSSAASGWTANGCAQGGTELLRSGGEAGESLLAGAGLLNLRGA